MKKTFYLSVFFSILLFAAACGNGSKNDSTAPDTDTIDEDIVETTDDETAEDAEVKDEYPIEENDNEPTETEDNDQQDIENDDKETPDGDLEEAENENQDDDGDTLTQVVPCEGLPENAEWYGTGTIEQTWNGTDWVPEAAGHYTANDPGDDSDKCWFKCSGNLVFLYNENKCVPDLCVEDNPCAALANSNGICTFNTYYNSYTCECNHGSLWNGDDCQSLTINGLRWSAKKEKKIWEEAITYCAELEEDGLTDWRLPTISELRTLVRNCDKTAPGGSCGITDECTQHSSCWSADCSGCYDAEIKTNVFGDDPNIFFWASQKDDEIGQALTMQYYSGSIGYLTLENGQGYARCVHKISE